MDMFQKAGMTDVNNTLAHNVIKLEISKIENKNPIRQLLEENGNTNPNDVISPKIIVIKILYVRIYGIPFKNNQRKCTA